MPNQTALTLKNCYYYQYAHGLWIAQQPLPDEQYCHGDGDAAVIHCGVTNDPKLVKNRQHSKVPM
jgi:hypothetical protein